MWHAVFFCARQGLAGLLSLCVSGLIQAGANTNTPSAEATSRTETAWQEVAASLRDPTDAISLTTADNQTFLVLSNPEQTGDSKGTLLLLADNQQHANWPGLLRHLRSELPQHGWSTLTLGLPNLVLASNSPLPSVPTSSSTASTITPNPQLQTYIQQSQQRFERTLQYLQEQKRGGKLIIISIGTAASAWLGARQAGYQASRQDGLILVDGYQPFADPQLNLTDQTLTLAAKIPVFDIYQPIHRYATQAQQRQRSAKQQALKNYQAEILPDTFNQMDHRFNPPEQIFIEKRLHAWLESHFISPKQKTQP